MGRCTPVPELRVGDLRGYGPALRFAVRLARAQEDTHRRKVELAGFVMARKHRRDLEELRELVEDKRLAFGVRWLLVRFEDGWEGWVPEVRTEAVA